VQDPLAVWDSTLYGGVYHLGDENDSLGQADMSIVNVDFVPGLIGDSAELTGAIDSYLVADGGASAGLFANGGTLMALVRPTDWGGNMQGRILDRATNNAVNRGWTFNIDNIDNNRQEGLQTTRLARQYDNGSRFYAEATDLSVALGVWTFVAVTYDESTDEAHMYIEGVDRTAGQPVPPPGASGPDPEPDTSLYIGKANETESASRWFRGRIDEARLVRTVRSPDWMMLEARSLRDQLITVGPVEVP
jgi:hypothetical protein